MELKFLRDGVWIYLNIGTYWLDERWWEKRIAFDFYVRGRGLGVCKVFREGKLKKAINPLKTVSAGQRRSMASPQQLKAVTAHHPRY